MRPSSDEIDVHGAKLPLNSGTLAARQGFDGVPAFSQGAGTVPARTRPAIAQLRAAVGEPLAARWLRRSSGCAVGPAWRCRGLGLPALLGRLRVADRITITTRRFALRPSTVVVALRGAVSRRSRSPRGESDRRPRSRARAPRCRRAPPTAPSSKRTHVLIGRLSVWPSTRIGFGNGASASPGARSRRRRSADSCALPLGNRMSVRISTSIQKSVRRTTTRSALTRSSIARSTWSATLVSAWAARCRALRDLRRHRRRAAPVPVVSTGTGVEHRARLAFDARLLHDACFAMSAPVAALLLADLDRLQRARRAAERGDQRIRQHAVLALVHRGDRIHHDEEGEQQRDEVAIGNGPRLVVEVLLVFLLAGHAVASPHLMQIALQLRFDAARVLALRDGQHAFDHHLADLGLRGDGAFELARRRAGRTGWRARCRTPSR